ncbi:hypothetical protein [Pseudobacillus badius]|uniref:hypothetical protein n=1 Tax=Bacillus badius TaxID=1455 RepID=UPI0007B03AD5|nr:hypothetical protein [Bacillus badius]KZO01112.1 hypothetical protein A4244_12650 [Bacillus badius]OCS89292.1 hypothetical protein A6M11_12665 [Bacillus badius]OVE51328.1 hypothetical protein B1A98_13205 [Bacillus badius]TDW02326.1 hypothetical protein B0G66_107159 [Bacillus badius]
MANDKGKDLRLWNRGNYILPFLSRSQKLAKDLMKTIGVKVSIIESFEVGKVLKTNCKNPLSITQKGISETDKEIIRDLSKKGLLVYHVLESYIMLNKQTEIQCEYEVSTYENVVSTKNYLCVPKDIFSDAMSFREDVADEDNRELIIKEYIEQEIFMANQGYLYAYTVRGDNGSGDFFNISINVFNGEVVRIS